jgi:HK97 family phage prohead protease
MEATLKAVQGDGGERIIEGMASTPAIDRQQEIVKPASMAEGLPEFMRNPLMTYNHDWYDPIGSWTEAEVREDGLFVRGRMLDAGDDLADSVWRRIEQNVVKSLSIGFDAKGDKDNPPGHYDEDSGIWIWDRIQLLEIAVTPLPANPEATMRTAKSLGLDLSLPTLPQAKTLPVADVDWTPVEAAKRLREAGYEDAPEYADVRDGELVAVWRGVQAAMASAKGLRGGDDPDLRDELALYYECAGEDVAEDVTPQEKAAFEESEFITNIHEARGKAISADNIRRHWRKNGRGLSPAMQSAVAEARDALDTVLEADPAPEQRRGLPALGNAKRARLPRMS